MDSPTKLESKHPKLKLGAPTSVHSGTPSPKLEWLSGPYFDPSKVIPETLGRKWYGSPIWRRMMMMV